MEAKSTKLRILFRTAGGKTRNKQLGFGHIFRCINLGKQLIPNDIFFLIEDYGNVKKTLNSRGFQNVSLLKKNIGLESDIINTTKFIIKKKIDIVIVDKYCISNSFLKKINKITKVVIITDLWKKNYQADLLINGFIGFEDSIIRNKFGIKCLLGPSYQILGKNIKRVDSKKQKNSILVTFGGFDKQNILKLFLDCILEYLNEIKLKVILGPGNNKTKKMKMLETKYPNNFKILSQTKDMGKEISQAMFGFCSGGITSYEFAALGIPFAIICQYKHQLKTAKEWQKKGIGFNLGLPNTKTKTKIQKLLQDFVENTTVIKKNKKFYVDGRGAQRAAFNILRL